MISRGFSVHLPSNTQLAENRTNKFTVRLPKKLEFGGRWMVGLTSINYPRSWRTLGTFETQFLEIEWNFRGKPKKLKYPIPSVTLKDAEHLCRVVFNQFEFHRNPETFDTTEDLDFTELVEKSADSLRVNYDPISCRYRITFNAEHIVSVSLSPQLAYIMGYSNPRITALESVADFEPDLSGGLSLLYVYASDMIEPVAVGDSTAPLLRIINVGSGFLGLNERIYDNVEYHNLLTKELTEIRIEIRTSSGELVPFQYGSCLLSLNFRKAPLL